MTRALLIVAHPDDDAIFCGPFQIAHRWMQWQAVCVTYHPGDDRACEMIRWQGQIGGQPPLFCGFPDDPQDLKRKQSSFSAETVAVALGALDVRPDLIVTHDLGGEYGHPHHVTTAQAVRSAFASVPIVAFGHYRRDANFRLEVPDFFKAAVTAFPSQRKVIKHLNRKLKCCRRGSYVVEGASGQAGINSPAG